MIIKIIIITIFCRCYHHCSRFRSHCFASVSSFSDVVPVLIVSILSGHYERSQTTVYLILSTRLAPIVHLWFDTTVILHKFSDKNHPFGIVFCQKQIPIVLLTFPLQYCHDLLRNHEEWPVMLRFCRVFVAVATGRLLFENAPVAFSKKSKRRRWQFCRIFVAFLSPPRSTFAVRFRRERDDRFGKEIIS